MSQLPFGFVSNRSLALAINSVLKGMTKQFGWLQPPRNQKLRSLQVNDISNSSSYQQTGRRYALRMYLA
jgi:hypothetical protein